MSSPNGENRSNQEKQNNESSNRPAEKQYSQSQYRYYTGGISGMPVSREGNSSSGGKKNHRRKIRWPVLISACVIGAALVVGLILVLRNLPKQCAPSGEIDVNQGTDAVQIMPVPTSGAEASETEKRNYVLHYADRYAENVYIDGINIGGMTRQEAEEAVAGIDYDANAKSDWKLELVYDNLRYEVEDDLLATSVDYDARSNALDYAFSIGKTDELSGKTVDDAYSELIYNSENGYSFETPVTIVSVALDAWLSGIANSIYVAPLNAYVSEFNPQNYSSPFKVVDDVPGQRLNVEAVKQDILRYAEEGRSGTYQLIPESVPADFTSADAWNSVKLRAKWTTQISTTSSDERNNNIVQAMRMVNGQILENGAVFSFNNLVKRTTLNGFLPAPAYVNREIATQVGGGVCQASSTIYMAALLSNLKIIERQPHSMAVSYTEFGKDATVNSEGRVIDLKFENDTGGTIYICAGVGEKNKRTVYCYIYGPAIEEGVYYDIETVEVETIIGAELEPEYRKDKEGLYVIYTDEEPYLAKEAVDGHVVEAYLLKYKYGEIVERTLISRDEFLPQKAVYYVGVEKPPVFPEDGGILP